MNQSRLALCSAVRLRASAVLVCRAFRLDCSGGICVGIFSNLVLKKYWRNVFFVFFFFSKRKVTPHPQTLAMIAVEL